MTKLIIIFFSCCLISCTTNPKKNFKIKSIPAYDKKQARSIIQNHINFLQILFKQSHDPYYNVPKWSSQCLKENEIGELIESETKLQSNSLLYLSKTHEVGYCSQAEGTYLAHVIYIYCEKKNEVLEMKIPVENQKNPEIISLCD